MFDFFTTKNDEIGKIQQDVLRKFPQLGITMSSTKVYPKNQSLTAETDGKNIFYAPKFFATLTQEEKVFVLAHEYLHIAFEHIPRSKGKDMPTWNFATDAVINQILLHENLHGIASMVNIKDAFGKSAEEVYNQIFQEKQNLQTTQNQNAERETTKQEGASTYSSNPNAQPHTCNNTPTQQTTGQNQAGHDNHSHWPEYANNTKKQSATQHASQHEKDFFEQNKQTKKQIAEKIRQQTAQNRAQNCQASKENFIPQEFALNEKGDSKPIISWKAKLKKEFETDAQIWLDRRGEECDFCPRLHDFYNHDNSVTEILLDTSGSVSQEFLREFLRQIKPIFKESKLFVGCFDTRFYGFTAIKNKSDIENFTFKGRGGTSFDTALKSFSKDNKINKIIFTDGHDTLSAPPPNLKNLIWLVFENKNFQAPVGKTIHVDPSKIKPKQKFQDLEK